MDEEIQYIAKFTATFFNSASLSAIFFVFGEITNYFIVVFFPKGTRGWMNIHHGPLRSARCQSKSETENMGDNFVKLLFK